MTVSLLIDTNFSTHVPPDPSTGEQVELRWHRPDGTEAVVLTRWYATTREAADALDRAILALT